MDMKIKQTAGLIQSMGRNGDTILAHINPEEARMLKAAGGSGTINPETGLPEYGFKLKKIFKAVAVAAAIYFTGGAALGTAGAVGSAVTGAAIGGGMAALSGGNILKGAVIGGIGGFITGGGLNDVSGWLGETSKSFFPQGAAEAASAAEGLSSAGSVEALSSAGKVAADAGISSSMTPKNFLNLPDNFAKTAATAAPKSTGGGLINSAVQWAEKNPTSALMVGQSVLSGVGGMATAQSDAEQAELNRAAAMENANLNREAQTVKGGWGSEANTVSANDPNFITDMNGRYIRGPNAGQYAPGRAPVGLINARA